MTAFEEAWYILKEDVAKKAIIDCLKKEGGAASQMIVLKPVVYLSQNVKNILTKWIMSKLVHTVMLC